MKKHSLVLLIVAPVLVVIGFFFVQQKPNITSEESRPTLNESGTMNTEASGSVYTNVSPQQDCSNECASFKDDAEKYTYCRTVCGFTTENGVPIAPAPTGSPLADDYALRDAAIRERDIRKCSLIQDSTLRKTCQVRVTEDLLE